jgi:hypothetical protein
MWIQKLTKPMESKKSMNPKSRHFWECTNAQTEQYEAKNWQTQTT